jgi:hypothetical protein
MKLNFRSGPRKFKVGPIDFNYNWDNFKPHTTSKTYHYIPGLLKWNSIRGWSLNTPGVGWLEFGERPKRVPPKQRTRAQRRGCFLTVLVVLVLMALAAWYLIGQVSLVLGVAALAFMVSR